MQRAFSFDPWSTFPAQKRFAKEIFYINIIIPGWLSKSWNYHWYSTCDLIYKPYSDLTYWPTYFFYKKNVTIWSRILSSCCAQFFFKSTIYIIYVTHKTKKLWLALWMSCLSFLKRCCLSGLWILSSRPWARGVYREKCHTHSLNNQYPITFRLEHLDLFLFNRLPSIFLCSALSSAKNIPACYLF